ncbi:MAG: diphosphate--fructose-6-phosphate 1-phosphotransferase, partial [Verrucomicrobia bacterium]|nr:diphosphate--fructose-6-phosphate 1-phosphotransferase [Verrucomicrobiota bacterium]
VVEQIAEVIEARRALGKKYGVVLIPEGLIEFIPEIKALISELNDLLSSGKGVEELSKITAATYASLPKSIQHQLLIDRDPHGNVQVSKIATEQLLMEMVEKVTPFNGIPHFFGYEGRSAFPTPFDCDYCYSLGLVAVRLIAASLSGLMASVRNLIRPVEEWTAEGIPLTQMFNLEKRHGKEKPVIRKALVDLQGAPFAHLEKHRKQWALEDRFRFPGPIQFEGRGTVAHQLPVTLVLEADLLPKNWSNVK